MPKREIGDFSMIWFETQSLGIRNNRLKIE